MKGGFKKERFSSMMNQGNTAMEQHMQIFCSMRQDDVKAREQAEEKREHKRERDRERREQEKQEEILRPDRRERKRKKETGTARETLQIVGSAER